MTPIAPWGCIVWVKLYPKLHIITWRVLIFFELLTNMNKYQILTNWNNWSTLLSSLISVISTGKGKKNQSRPCPTTIELLLEKFFPKILLGYICLLWKIWGSSAIPHVGHPLYYCTVHFDRGPWIIQQIRSEIKSHDYLFLWHKSIKSHMCQFKKCPFLTCPL